MVFISIDVCEWNDGIKIHRCLQTMNFAFSKMEKRISLSICFGICVTSTAAMIAIFVLIWHSLQRQNQSGVLHSPIIRWNPCSLSTPSHGINSTGSVEYFIQNLLHQISANTGAWVSGGVNPWKGVFQHPHKTALIKPTLYFALPLKKARSSIGAPVVLPATRPLVVYPPPTGHQPSKDQSEKPPRDMPPPM